MKIVALATLVLMIVSSLAHAQYGLPDSILFGNLDGSVQNVGLGQHIAVPVWIKTDDSVIFITAPIKTYNHYIASRDGGIYFQPLSMWDFTFFDSPCPNGRDSTSQEILAVADEDTTSNPHYLYLNYQWSHVADFWMTTTTGSAVLGDTTCLREGTNPAQDLIFFGMSDGLHSEDPGDIFGCLRFIDAPPPGDVNMDAVVNGPDVVYLVGFLRGNRPAPEPLLRADANGDCGVNGLDVVYLVNCLTGRGSRPRLGNCQ